MPLGLAFIYLSQGTFSLNPQFWESMPQSFLQAAAIVVKDGYSSLQ